MQTRINSSAKQIFSAIWLDINKKDPLFKPQDIYNRRAIQKSNQLGPYSPIQAFMIKLSQQDSWFMEYFIDHHNRITKLFFVKKLA